MHVNADKEEGGTVCMDASDESSVVYIPADVGHGGEGCCDI